MIAALFLFSLLLQRCANVGLQVVDNNKETIPSGVALRAPLLQENPLEEERKEAFDLVASEAPTTQLHTTLTSNNGKKHACTYWARASPPIEGRDIVKAEPILIDNKASTEKLLSILLPNLRYLIYSYLDGLTELKLAITDSERYSDREREEHWRKLDSCVFNAKKWEKYYGYVGQEPGIPARIRGLLNRECKLWPGKKVYETSILTLIPEYVDGHLLTLDRCSQLIKRPHIGHKTKYSTYNRDVKIALGSQTVVPSRWVLMTRDLLPDSRYKLYEDQCAFSKQCAEEFDIAYTLPSILEGVVSTLCHHVQTGEKLFNNRPKTYSRCMEKVCDQEYPTVFGGFSSSGLGVGCYFDHPYDYFGVALCVR